MVDQVSHYRIIEELGKGGMGVVYKAEDTRLGRNVALKVLTDEFTHDDHSRNRFIREAKIASSIQDINICTIHEIDETDDGKLFICMDYYEGRTLQEVIRQDTLPLDLIIEYGIQLASGISKAHKKGIIHRDIKPGNIIVNPDGNLIILDFGLAKLQGDHRITKTGKVAGSMAYMSPEQTLGSELDQQTDIWSYGVILYEMATGILPFSHEYDAALVYSILDKNPEPPTMVNDIIPEQLENIIYKCLKKDKNQRYQSFHEITEDLAALREQQSLEKLPGNILSKPKVSHTEKRLITVMVLEIQGLNILFQQREEQEIISFVEKCYEIVRKHTENAGGKVTGQSDQTFTCIWGLTEKSEKSSLKALNTSLKIKTALGEIKSINKEQQKLQVRAGINTGTAIIKTNVDNDRTDYAVLGETVILTHRLMEFASPGMVLVSQSTYRNANRIFKFSQRKPLMISGSSDLLHNYLLDTTEAQDISMKGYNPLQQIELLGRETELVKLQLHLLQLLQGKGHVINVIGEAGVGKSRLISEFLKAKELSRINLLVGRGTATGENLRYQPIIQWIKKLFEIKEGSNDKDISLNVRSRLQQMCGNEADELLPYVKALLGINKGDQDHPGTNVPSGEGFERNILKNLRTFFTMISLEKPLVLVIEDLHWIDQSSVALLKSLYSLSTEYPILFINVLRPEYVKTGDVILDSIRKRCENNFTDLVLFPLDKAHTDDFISKLLGIEFVPQNLSSILYARTEGLPLYIEEFIYALMDRNLVKIDNKKVEISGDTKAMGIPDTIQEVLQSRISQLDGDSRLVIKTASVIGREFSLRILLELTGNYKETLDTISYLEQLNFFSKKDPGNDDAYIFRHVLIQQATYDTILPGEKKEMHHNVAKALEKTYANQLENFYGVLALHYSLAEDLVNSESYLIMAGEQALHSAASNEALNFFRQALDTYLEKYGSSADPAKIALLNKYIGIAHHNVGHFIETDYYLGKVLESYGIRFPKNKLLLTIRLIGAISVLLLRIAFPGLLRRKTPTKRDVEIDDLFYKKATGLLIIDNKRFIIEYVLMAPRITGYKFRSLKTFGYITGIFSVGGISMSIADKLNKYTEQLPELAYQSNAFSFEGWMAYYNLATGNWGKSSFSEEMLHLGMQLGDLDGLNNYLYMTTHMGIEKGNRESIAIINRISRIALMYEYDYFNLARYTHTCLYHFKFGQLEKLIPYADEGIEYIAKNLGNIPGRIMLYSHKIRALVKLSRIREAEKELALATELSKNEQLGPFFYSFFIMAQFTLTLCKLESTSRQKNKKEWGKLMRKVRTMSRKSLRVSKKAAWERIEALRLTGTLSWLAGKQPKAIEHWKKAAETAKAFGGKIELAHTYKEIADRLETNISKYHEFNGKSLVQIRNMANEIYHEIQID